MLRVIVSILVLAPATALAVEPSQPVPKPPQTCVASGRIVFEKHDHGFTRDTRTTTLHESGAWTYVHREDGKLVERRTGCLAGARLREVRAKRAKLTFVRTYPRGCRGRASFRITVDDRVVFAGNHCSELDFASSWALFDVAGTITKP